MKDTKKGVTTSADFLSMATQRGFEIGSMERYILQGLGTRRSGKEYLLYAPQIGALMYADFLSEKLEALQLHLEIQLPFKLMEEIKSISYNVQENSNGTGLLSLFLADNMWKALDIALERQNVNSVWSIPPDFQRMDFTNQEEMMTGDNYESLSRIKFKTAVLNHEKMRKIFGDAWKY